MIMMKSFVPLLLASVALGTSCQAQQQQQQQLVRNGRDAGGRRSLLPCLGIFRDCSDTGTTDTPNTGDGGLLDGNLCLGIFRNCSETNSTNTNNSNSNSTKNCTESTDGAFGGRPLFGECGIVGEVLGQIFNGSNSVNGTFNDTNGDGIPDGPFVGLLPEGGLLWQIFNRPSDQTILEALAEAYSQNTQTLTGGFLQDWAESAVTTNATCNATNTTTTTTNSTAAPACFDAFGNEGFWICRTLTNPFTGNASSKSLCINQGTFLENNDACGCCLDTCPAPCTCPCTTALGGSGVLITTNLTSDILLANNDTNSTTTTAGVVSCVDPRLAVSITSRVNNITCVETCPV